MSPAMKLAFCAACSFTISVLLTPVLILMARRLQVVARPNPIVKTHASPTPCLGGIAVYLGFIAGLVSLGMTDNHLRIAGCIGLMLAVGCTDDLRPLSVPSKLIAQVLVCTVSAFVLAGLNPALFHGAPAVLSVFWLLLMTNAVNVVDVMDGLAPGISALGCVGIFIIAQIGGFVDVSGMTLALAAALAGFLPFNRHRARIFLGDAGSLSIGFALGLMPLLEPALAAQPRILIGLLIVFAVPLFEVGFISAVRSLANKPFWKPGEDHFALRLLALGWRVPRIVNCVYTVQSTLVLTALVFVFLYPGLGAWLAVGAVITGASSLAAYLAKISHAVEQETS